MPHLRTNYRKKWLATRKIITANYASTALSGAGAAGRVYMGPVDFSINAYTNASGIAVVSVKTVLSIFGNPSSQATRLEPIAIEPLSFSTYSYSGAKGPSQVNPGRSWSLIMAAGSMWASGSLMLFVPSLSDVVIAGSAPAVARVTAIVCSGPAS